MSEIKLGHLIDGNHQRDAVHVAVAPVVAAHVLAPGEEIGFIENGNTKLVGTVENPIGVVDPWLPRAILKGQWFFMLLNPGTTNALRHEWSHPAFEPALLNDPKPAEPPAVQEEYDACRNCVDY